MSSITLNVADAFPPGTSVSAYPRSNWVGDTRPGGAPVGSSAATATVASDGTLTFASLTDGVVYEAYAQVGGVDRYRRFMPSTPPSSAESSDQIVHGGNLGATYSLPVSATRKQVLDGSMTQDLTLTLPGWVEGAKAKLSLLKDTSGRKLFVTDGVITPFEVDITSVAAGGTIDVDLYTTDGVTIKIASGGTPGPQGIPGIGLSQAAADVRYDRDPTLPSGAFWQNLRRNLNLVATVAPLTSGRLFLVRGPRLAAGETVTSIKFISGTTAGATLTHTWFSLISIDLATILGKTTDDTSASWAATTPKSLSLSSPYTPGADIDTYIGIVCVGTTMPSLRGLNGLASIDTPHVAGNAATGLTDPASLTSVGALTSAAQQPYASVA